MANQSLIQFRVDEDLKKEVIEIYEELGMDLPTALRMFMKKSKMVRGIPFDTVLPNNKITKSEALNAFYELRTQASQVGELTLEEINDEIKRAREERRRNNL